MERYIDKIDNGREAPPPLMLLSSREVLMHGVQLVYSQARIYRVRGDPSASKTNMQRFKDHFGANSVVVAKLWEELQTTNLPRARVMVLKFDAFLEALNFVYRYKRESEREAQFDKSPKTVRKWSWYYLVKIQALKASKIVFPSLEEMGTDIWIMTVDGTHSIWNEPSHAEFSQDRKAFSFKKHHAGLCYELGISLFESKLIWMNGSFYAGANDKKNFVDRGLKDKLEAIGKKALGDKGYCGYSKECSTFNPFDSDALKQFKSRAQMRHEQFNGMLKEFSSLDNQFRHSQMKFDVCFEAVCVICQYRMEHGEPLFDLLAGIDVQLLDV